MGIRLKDLSKLGYRDNVARSLAVALVGKYCKHETKEQILAALGDILKNPEVYKTVRYGVNWPNIFLLYLSKKIDAV